MHNMDLIQRYQSKSVDSILVLRFNNFEMQIPFIYLILIIELLIYFINNQYILMTVKDNYPHGNKSRAKRILKNIILLFLIGLSVGVIVRDVCLGVVIGCGIGIITFSALVIVSRIKRYK